eukprot:gene792-904_t
MKLHSCVLVDSSQGIGKPFGPKRRSSRARNMPSSHLPEPRAGGVRKKSFRRFICINFQKAQTRAAQAESSRRSSTHSESGQRDIDWRHPARILERRLVDKNLSANTTAPQDVRTNNEIILKRFASFLPIDLLYILNRGEIKNHFAGLLLDTFEAAVVFVDASGFTKCTEELSTKANGADLLSKEINNFFHPILRCARQWGGDVLRFSGDAVTIAFPVQHLNGDSNSLRAAASRAAQCCLEMPTVINGSRFSLHSGIGVGKVTISQAGGQCDRWEYVVSGPPLEQVAIAEDLAKAGETVVSPEAWCIARGLFVESKSTVTDDGSIFRTLGTVKSNRRRRALEVPQMQPQSLALMKKYIPSAVSDRLSTGHGTFIDEIRTVSILFLNIPAADLDVSTPEGVCKAHILMSDVQTVVYAQEGSVNKFLVDDKGVTLLIVFGLSPMVHIDDALRAMVAGLRIGDKLRELKQQGIMKQQGKVAVTTGRIFCGFVGDEESREYTVLGDPVNLGARLMRSDKNQGLLCDEDTNKKVYEKLEMIELLPPIKVRGKDNPVRVYKTTGRVNPKLSTASKHTSLNEFPGWNQDKELKKIEAMKGKGGILCII